MAKNTGISVPVVGAALACLLLAMAPSRASSDLCAQLEASLATAEISGGDARTARFDDAIDVQQGELRKAREEARIARCDFEMTGDAVARCASINSQIAEMERNLLSLLNERSALVGHDVSGGERSRLLGMIEAHGCDRTGKASGSGPPRVIDGRNGLEIRQNDLSLAGGDPNHIVLLPNISVDPNGSYRTMCVRTCDGYYFPISYAVTPAQFSADEAACAARCPDTKVRLYFHRVPEEEPEDMVSAATGAPYTELPNAFLYRKPNHGHVRGCTCRATNHDSFSNIAGTPPGANEGGAIGLFDGWGDGGSIVTLPLPAPGERDASPGTEGQPASALAAPEPEAAGQATATKDGDEPEKTEATARPMPDRPVRVVGPKFLPDPSKAIILRDPDPTAGR